MDLRKRKRETTTSATVLLMVIFAVVLIVGLIKVTHPSAPPETEPGMELRVDPSAEDGPLKGFKASDKRNAEDVLSYRINSRIYFKNGGAKGDLCLENPRENRWLMQLELILEDDGQLVYTSGYLKPDQHIDEAKLDQELEKGVYPATAWFQAVDPETEELIGVLQQPVTLYVGVKKPK